MTFPTWVPVDFSMFIVLTVFALVGMAATVAVIFDTLRRIYRSLLRANHEGEGG